MDVYAVLWKELKDLSRDRRTLIAVVILPLLSLPLLGAVTLAVYRTQPIAFALVNGDGSSISSEIEDQLKQLILISAQASGQRAEIYEEGSLESALKNPLLDYVVYIPPGFGKNASSVDYVAYLEGFKRADTARADTAQSIFFSAVSYLSSSIAQQRIEVLLKEANLTAAPEVIMQPVRVKQSSYVSGGGQAPPNAEELNYTARMLAFALFFVTTPALSYMVDSIMGEKERKTIESLLSLPVSRKSLLGGKIMASSIIGILAGAADVAGVVLYFYLISLAFGGGGVFLDLGLIAVHSLDVAITAFATCAMVSPLIISSRSSRGANATTAAVTGLAIIIFFLALLADVSRLPSYAYYPLLLIPYMNSVMVLLVYVQGSMLSLALHLLLLLGETALLYALAFRMFKPESLLMPPIGEE
ncbi:MAG: ABC transporter permease subunit [Fervidicoccaceae archaeon]